MTKRQTFAVNAYNNKIHFSKSKRNQKKRKVTIFPPSLYKIYFFQCPME